MEKSCQGAPSVGLGSMLPSTPLAGATSILTRDLGAEGQPSMEHCHALDSNKGFLTAIQSVKVWGAVVSEIHFNCHSIKRQSSGILDQKPNARQHFTDCLTSELHIKGIRTQFYIFSPGNSTCLGYGHLAKKAWIIPCLEHPSPRQMRKINLSGSFVGVPEPYPKSFPGFDLYGTDQ